jgi:hypothetical protein
MTDDELLAALRLLKPTSELPGLALFKADVLERAGIDPAHLERFTAARGGRSLQAGHVKPKKGKKPDALRPGRPQTFYAVPSGLLAAD